MGSFVEELVGTFGGEVTEQLSSKLGIDKNTATKILPQVAPLILGGMKRQMQTRGGADRVNHILNKYGNDGVLNDIGGLFSQKAKESKPDPGLGGLLGDSGVQAANLLTRQFNLSGSTAMKIIPMLAPVVLGALTRKRDSGGAGVSGIAALIDQDGDGNILDDVAGFLMGGGAGGRGGSGMLGNLLGSLLGRK
ncbi:MAG: DUF937 domain-containing protein [Calditrichaeota bacterium]|nr:MAG: DUF937 domain-containing protein [Calditrichota bacterium]